MELSQPSPHLILIVEDDQDNRETLNFLLQEEGYQTLSTSSLVEAGLQLETTTFDFILTDLFDVKRENAFTSIHSLKTQAFPTPVGVITAHTLPPGLDTSEVAFVLNKPFHIDELLGHIAAHLHQTLRLQEDEQAQIVDRFFLALNQRNWTEATDLCTTDVVFLPPTSASQDISVRGSVALREYLSTFIQEYPDAHFEHLVIYPLPKGRVARYSMCWGEDKQVSGVTSVRFHLKQLDRIRTQMDLASAPVPVISQCKEND